MNTEVKTRASAGPSTHAAVQRRVAREAQGFALLQRVRGHSVTQFRRAGLVAICHVEGGGRSFVEGSARMFFDGVPFSNARTDQPSFARSSSTLIIARTVCSPGLIRQPQASL